MSRERITTRFKVTLPIPMLPIPHAPIRIKRPLWQLLFKWMFGHLCLIDLNTKTRPITRTNCAAVFLYRESLGHDILPPRNVFVYGFADDVGRCREAEFQRGGRAEGALRIVGVHRDAVGLAHGGESSGLAQAAAVSDVGLDDAAGPRFQVFPDGVLAD